MKSLVIHLKENVEIPQEIKNLESSFRKIFPHGFFSINRGFGNTTERYSMYIKMGLIGNASDAVSGILFLNDPMPVVFQVEVSGEKVNVSFDNGISIMVNPKERHLAMSRHKIQVRKFSTDLKTLPKKFEQLLVKLKSEVKKVESDIKNRSSYPDKYFR